LGRWFDWFKWFAISNLPPTCWPSSVLGFFRV
jgi:hypothetical protein